MILRRVTSYVFYVIAAPFIIFAVWSFVSSAEVISEAIEVGQITVFGNLYDIVSFYMANTSQYFAFAFLLVGMGILLGRKEKAMPIANEAESAKSQNDAELDEWFGSNNKEDE